MSNAVPLGYATSFSQTSQAMMQQQLRVAVITGGMGGLGESISTKMHVAGYRGVVTHSLANTRVKDWLGEHNAAGRQFSAYGVDIADFDSCAGMDDARPKALARRAGVS